MDFPEEVIVEILSWVPAKSLMRFKCVSKQWLHLLSTDHSFIKLHFHRSIQTNNNNNSILNPGVFALQLSGENGEHPFYFHAEDILACDKATLLRPPFSNPSNLQFVHVCNGLLCLADNFIQYNKSMIYVWNPITGDHITIPFPSIPSHFFHDNGRVLDCGVDFTFDFGYNEMRDEYKVILSVSTSPIDWIWEKQSHFFVYTLGTGGSWRTLQGIPMYNFSAILNFSSAFVNGAFHWFVYKLESSDQGFRRALVSFDIHNEIFEEIPQPDGITYDYPFDVCMDNSLEELDGLLCIFCRLPNHPYVEIWAMEEYGAADSWIKLWKIPKLQASVNYYTIIGFADSGGIVLENDSRQWTLYDHKTNSLRELPRFESQMFDAHTFKGSVLSPTIIDGASRTIQQNKPHD